MRDTTHITQEYRVARHPNCGENGLQGGIGEVYSPQIRTPYNGFDFDAEKRYGIWTPRQAWGESYYVLDTERHGSLGPFNRWDVLRTFQVANAQIEVGSRTHYTMEPGFWEIFKPSTLQEGLEAFDRVEPAWVSPCLTFYRWHHGPSDPPVRWAQGSLTAAQQQLLGEALAVYQLSDEPMHGILEAQRNCHRRGSIVIQDPSAATSYAVVDTA